MDLSSTIQQLNTQSWAYAALGAAIETGLLAQVAEGGEDGLDEGELAARSGLPEDVVGVLVDVLASRPAVRRGTARGFAARRPVPVDDATLLPRGARRGPLRPPPDGSARQGAP
ncbi:MAG: hypothetical protein U5R31_00225 [Acidimicrobiia bacterium]|nr:hypothetical protein [Acidimicrobiia bacterium]